MKLSVIIALLVTSLSILLPQSALANTAPTKLFISGTTLTVQGHATAKALVEIKSNNAIIGTTVADNTGYFEKYFSAFDSGLNTISLSYKDKFGSNSDTLVKTINVKPQQNTSFYVYLPPILNIASKEIIEGELQEVFGYTRPFSIVEITVDGGALILRPRADADGYYSITFATNNYYTGQHIINAKSIFETTSSQATNTNSFLVNSTRQNIISRELLPPEFTISNPLRASGSTTLEGTGPINSQIIFYENSQPIGSTFVNSEGNWIFRYFATQNTSLDAIACYQDNCSAKSQPLKIIKIEGQNDQCRNNFSLLEYRYFDINPNQEISININAINAIPPLKIEVNWGDGETSTLTHDTTTALNISHVYKQVGQYNASVAILDEEQCAGERYFTVEVDTAKFNPSLLWFIPATLVVTYSAYLTLRKYEITQEKASESLDKI